MDEVGLEHLHAHSMFSLLDGFATPEEYAQRAVKHNQKYLPEKFCQRYFLSYPLFLS